MGHRCTSYPERGESVIDLQRLGDQMDAVEGDSVGRDVKVTQDHIVSETFADVLAAEFRNAIPC